MLLKPTTAAGRGGLRAVQHDPGHALLAFDYDGTLAPIVEDPAEAVPHPDVLASLGRLAGYVGLVAIVTGRPARVAAEIGGFVMASGLDRLVVVGHYGNERWDAATGSLQTVDAPPGLDRVRQELPELLDSLGLGAAHVEDKGLSVVVHVRRMAHPAQAFARMEDPLRALAESHQLVAEQGRFAMELRTGGTDKGRALRALVEEYGATSVVFTGDDLGDLAAFDEVDRLRAQGLPGLLVCSGSAEVRVVAERADLVVDGPAGVADFVATLVSSLAG